VPEMSPTTNFSADAPAQGHHSCVAAGRGLRILCMFTVVLALVGSEMACAQYPKLLSYPQLRNDTTTAIQDKGYVVQEIRNQLYWLSDGAYNTMFLVTSDGVVAIDPLPTLAERYLRAIAEVTDKPVTHVIYSHEHLDHIGAASLFPKDAIIIAQDETAALLKKRADPRRPIPIVTFSDHYTLTVGGQTLELDYHGDNHAPGNIFIYAPRQRVIMLVDVVYPGYMPYKNLGITDNVQGYIEAHRQLLACDFDTLVAGHVTRLGTRADVETSLEFVEELLETARQALGRTSFPAFLQAPTAKALASSEQRDKWDLHNEYEKTLVEECYAHLHDKWSKRLMDTDTYLRDNCWAMLNAVTVQLPPTDR
jgi:glyoxylase-like metal-dependent hydrolase (beta-lactamase superfamily II)